MRPRPRPSRQPQALGWDILFLPPVTMELEHEPLGIPLPRASRHRSRRLRKKLFLDEFQQMGFSVAFKLDPELPRDQAEILWDRFLDEAIEGNGLSCGGGGSWHEAHFYVMPAYGPGHRSAQPHQRTAVLEWFEANRDQGVVDYGASPLMDANYDIPGQP